MSIIKSVFECKTCNKNYKSYNSLGNHNRRFHQSILQKNISENIGKISETSNKLSEKLGKISEDIISKNMKVYNCRKCNKIYNNLQSRWSHEKICNNNIILYDNKIEQLENKIIELENKISNNNIITNNTNTNNSTTNTNNGTINNTTNNIIKVSFGEEDISVLSCRDKKMILNSGFNSIIKLIETMHLNNNYKQFQNVQITNLKDKYGKYYDDTTKQFITKIKSELMDEIIAIKTMNLKEIHGEYNKNTNNHKNVLKLINKIEDYTTDDKILSKFYKELCEEITLLFYNKSKMFN
jgi:hypothetical protein